MKIKKSAFFAVFLLCATSIVQAKPRFSLLWENSFLTGKINLKVEKPDGYDFEEYIKGGQSLLIFRCQFNEYLSIGAGSGAHVNKFNASYEFWGTHNFSLPMMFIPFFAEARGILPILRDVIRLYGDAKIGGSISPMKLEDSWFAGKVRTEDYFSGGFFFEPSVGISFNFGRITLDLGVGYHLQTSQYVSYYYSYDPEYDDHPEEEIEYYPFDLNQTVFKLGIGILFGKK